MKSTQAIRSILNDPKFEAVMAVANGMIEEWNALGNVKLDTIEKTAMNTIDFASRVKALEDFFNRLKQESTKDLKQEDNE